METQHVEKTVLPEKFGGGPLGLGDPNDRNLRRVEREILIPKKMRDLAKEEKCTLQVKAFEDCCKSNGVLMVVQCRSENTELKSCLTHWYQDADFKQYCTEVYLKERAEYRRTGKKHLEKKFES